MNNDLQSVGVGIACFVWKDGKFLMQQRMGSHGAGTWGLPGGTFEYGESFEECARREVLEETGMQISNVRFIALTNDIFVDKGKHDVGIWMYADWLSGEPYIAEPGKCTAQEWRNFQSLPSNLFQPYWNNLRLAQPALFDKAHGRDGQFRCWRRYISCFSGLAGRRIPAYHRQCHQ
jgi:8-oxo-dGTP diphosphatase